MRKEIPKGVVAIAEAIREMKVRGAGEIARAAVAALMLAAKNYPREGPEEDPEGFRRYMHEVAELLVSTRPTAVSLPNAVAYVLSRVDAAVVSTVGELVEVVRRSSLEFIERSKEAIARIGEIGAKRILSGETLLTHCHSSAAVRIVLTAHRQGKTLKVYSTETRPRLQGRITAKQLAAHGVDVIQIPDSAVRAVMPRVDKVIVGADAITSDGFVVNKIGTSQVALAAKEARVRVMVAAETYKFSPVTVAGLPVIIEERDPSEVVSREWLAKNPMVKVLNPAFDITPPAYVDMIVTELGVIPPESAALVLKEVFGIGPGSSPHQLSVSSD